MSAIVKTDAIILRNANLTDSSRYALALTKEFGKITFVAKGIRRPTSRFGAALEPFTLSHIVFYQKDERDKYYISQCDIVEAFVQLRQDLEKISSAAAAVNLLDQFTPPGERNVALFNLLFSILTEFNRSLTSELPILFLAFQLKLLTLTGFQPILGHCACCQKTITSGYFIPEHGGVVCNSCQEQAEKPAAAISSEIISVFHHFLSEKFAQNKKWQISEGTLRQMTALLKIYTEFYSEQALKTFPIL